MAAWVEQSWAAALAEPPQETITPTRAFPAAEATALAKLVLPALSPLWAAWAPHVPVLASAP